LGMQQDRSQLSSFRLTPLEVYVLSAPSMRWDVVLLLCRLRCGCKDAGEKIGCAAGREKRKRLCSRTRSSRPRSETYASRGRGGKQIVDISGSGTTLGVRTDPRTSRACTFLHREILVCWVEWEGCLTASKKCTAAAAACQRQHDYATTCSLALSQSMRT